MSRFKRITRREMLGYWWLIPAGLTLGTLGGMGLYAARVLGGKHEAGEAQFQAEAPAKIGAWQDFPEVWSSLEFQYAGVPAVAVRLPEASPGSLSVEGGHLAAYSRLCTHQGCPVVMVREPEVLAFAYNYRPSDPAEQHPQLGCPCHYSVFDPARGGQAIFGKAVKPLPRIQLEAHEDGIFAIGIET